MAYSPISKDELLAALKQMAKGCPDAVTLEIFLHFWDVIGDDYTSMLQDSISHKHLPQGMTSGVIALIFKKGDRDNLFNYRPITLLNISYKTLAKTLQIRL